MFMDLPKRKKEKVGELDTDCSCWDSNPGLWIHSYIFTGLDLTLAWGVEGQLSWLLILSSNLVNKWINQETWRW